MSERTCGAEVIDAVAVEWESPQGIGPHGFTCLYSDGRLLASQASMNTAEQIKLNMDDKVFEYPLSEEDNEEEKEPKTLSFYKRVRSYEVEGRLREYYQPSAYVDRRKASESQWGDPTPIAAWNFDEFENKTHVSDASFNGIFARVHGAAYVCGVGNCLAYTKWSRANAAAGLLEVAPGDLPKFNNIVSGGVAMWFKLDAGARARAQKHAAAAANFTKSDDTPLPYVRDTWVRRRRVYTTHPGVTRRGCYNTPWVLQHAAEQKHREWGVKRHKMTLEPNRTKGSLYPAN